MAPPFFGFQNEAMQLIAHNCILRNLCVLTFRFLFFVSLLSVIFLSFLLFFFVLLWAQLPCQLLFLLSLFAFFSNVLFALDAINVVSGLVSTGHHTFHLDQDQYPPFVGCLVSVYPGNHRQFC